MIDFGLDFGPQKGCQKGPKMDPKSIKNRSRNSIRKRRLLGSLLVPFWGRFGCLPGVKNVEISLVFLMFFEKRPFGRHQGFGDNLGPILEPRRVPKGSPKRPKMETKKRPPKGWNFGWVSGGPRGGPGRREQGSLVVKIFSVGPQPRALLPLK